MAARSRLLKGGLIPRWRQQLMGQLRSSSSKQQPGLAIGRVARKHGHPAGSAAARPSCASRRSSRRGQRRCRWMGESTNGACPLLKSLARLGSAAVGQMLL